MAPAIEAPIELMTEFLGAISDSQYTRASTLCEQVLKFEPRNLMMLEYRTALQRLLKQQGDSSSSDDESSSSSDNDTSEDEGNDTSEDEGKDNDSEDERKDNDDSSSSSSEAEETSEDELREVLDEFGLRGTQGELVENLRWISEKCREEKN